MLDAVIADVVSHPSPSDARLLSDISHIANLHIVYVNQAATGANNGTSWKNAYKSLQTAIADAAAWNPLHNGETEILVAAGTYSAGTSAGSQFILPDGVAIIGGVNAKGQCDPINNLTYLTGVAGKSVVGVLNGVSDIIDGVNISNASGLAGCAMDVENQSNLLIYNGTFSNDQASFAGGAIYSSQSSLAVFASSFTNDSTGSFGGAIDLDHNTNVTLNYSKFSTNTAGQHGGSIATYFDTNITMSNDTFSGNNAVDNGGALNFDNNPNVSISNSSFGNNSAGLGGAICEVGGQMMTLSHNSFSYNSASSYGGAIELENLAIVDSSIFDHNTSLDGAIDDDFTNGMVAITNDIFTNNKAIGNGADGGAIGTFQEAGQVAQIVYKNDIFINNSATGPGSAIWDHGNSQVTITNSLFLGNTATQQGGGAIWEEDSVGAVTITGDAFGFNTAPQGNSIWLDGSQPSVNGDSVMTNWINDLVNSNYFLPSRDIFIQ